MNCGVRPEKYYCRPSRQWTISGYYGTTATKQCADHFLGDQQVFAGEGRLRVILPDQPPRFYDNGNVTNGTLCAILSQTPERFFFVFWEQGSHVGGRYGLVRRYDDDTGELTCQQWKAMITPELIGEFRAWLEAEVLPAPKLPAIVIDTLRHAIACNFNLPVITCM